ncbi:alpha-amylase family glycosyl hydrolase [Petrocella sp. FN5]|uniref:alpha-amylase family glycosyl hydrolase n=1 Tax=Petrocella sp. FN5 TaxID=3032002 RepID=UPI0023DCCBBF|nr:alpha-amylase family glycosyl hydrolase [Petrocella sp. FN5]MDF1618103.1 alpha-amylase family glycosyl hydrolase [Petrocella sp. FN5]
MKYKNIYHIFPLGYTGANQSTNDGNCRGTLRDIESHIPEMVRLGITDVLLGPIFESETHGYDTVDYNRIDRRLGTRQDMIDFSKACHNAGIHIVLDCVFNHVSRSHFAFEDLKDNKHQSAYKAWFLDVDFNGQSSLGDSFSYACWDGHEHLVKLNLDYEPVRKYLINTAVSWKETYGIDGLRMDAADVMSLDFLRELSKSMKEMDPDFCMIGEVVHGDYNLWLDEGGMDQVTNYELYKGLYSSLNDKNYYEVAYALNRQFGQKGVYQGEGLYNFVDNHDVNRVAEVLVNKGQIYPLYIMLYTIPGSPSLYYGSEYGIMGKKNQTSDTNLRPSWRKIMEQKDEDLFHVIERLSGLRSQNQALHIGNYEPFHLTHETIGYKRVYESETLYIMINAKTDKTYINTDALVGSYWDLLNHEMVECQGGAWVDGLWGRILMRK